MGRTAKNKRRRQDEEEEELEEGWSFLHPDTTKGILAVIFFALALILVLSAFNSAGPAGNFIYQILSSLFGIGYYLLPVISLIITGVLLISGQKKPISRTMVGGLLFVIFGLGFIDVVFPGRGGFLGSAVGSLESLFGYTASIIITLALIVTALLITLNLPLQIKRRAKENLSSESGLTAKELQEIEASSDDDEEAEIEEEEDNYDDEEEAEELDIKDSSVAAPRRPAKRIDFGSYVAPPLNLLKSSNEKATAGDLRVGANIIKRTFESFNIPVEMGEINIGPKVTRYTLKPAEGVKLSKITGLGQDLALALAAHPIRIEAPIPGKSLVGIEVPNKTAAIVRLGNLMATDDWEDAGNLGIIMGRDVTGIPIIEDISKMPHMLIAGATGSGKSVTIHTLLISLLYKNSPETLRLVLIDPKRVELSNYHDLPHLVAPVVTQNKKAVGVFRWAIQEMEQRYEMLEAEGARDILSYNEKVGRRQDGVKLPYVMIVVDELADLMSSFGKEVEGYIVRISQMARAVGLHLILATQRPSVEIITGLIKANITTRAALKVASQIDSRTILDTAGAEKLLGGGDMLLISSKYSKPLRIQGAFITEDEIRSVTSFIRDNNADLSEEIASEAPEFDKSGSTDSPSSPKNVFDSFEAGSEDGDDLLEDAVDLVRESGKASASLLQRRLKVGYARAARLLDIMEERGIIGPGSGAKPREVYLGNEGDADFSREADED